MTRVSCPECGAANLLDARFCEQCGATLPLDAPAAIDARQSLASLATAYVTLGADPDCDIVVNHQSVSGKHARISLTSDDMFLLEDLNSRNGSFVNDSQVKRARLTFKDKLRLAKQRVALGHPRLLQLIVLPGSARGGNVVTVGRDPSNHVQVRFASVSGHHLQLTRERDQWQLQDLGSQNGTFLEKGGTRVQTASVGSQDSILLGNVPVPITLIESALALGAVGDAPRPSAGRTISATIAEGEAYTGKIETVRSSRALIWVIAGVVIGAAVVMASWLALRKA